MSPRQKRRRRSGGAHSPKELTRAKIVEAGLGLVDRDDIDAITMRRLADVLGVTPMALYNHVSSKRDLLRAVAEHILGEARFDGAHGDWREQIKYCFRTFREVCLRHPGMGRLLEAADIAPAAVFVPMEVTLRALDQVGFNSQDALRTYFTLVSFTLYQASYQSRGPFPDLEPSEKIRAERLAGRGYGAIERLDAIPDWDFDAAFEFGLALIIGGVERWLGQRRDAGRATKTGATA
jgi:TetR/AcrR family transcriptional regulator, tetracycline repressor protein